MRCFDARKKLSALLDGEGDVAAREAVARHVDGCPACRAELEALEGVNRLLAGTLGNPEAPAGYHDGLWGRLEARLEGEGQDLDDVRALASSAIARASKEQAAAFPDLLQAPAVLGQVVLPSAGPPPRRGRWAIFAAATTAIAAAGVVGMFVRGRAGQAPAAATAAPSEPPAAVAPVPAPEVTPIAAPSVPTPEASPSPPPPPKKPVAATPRPTTPAPEPAATPPAKPPKPEKPEKTADQILEELSTPTSSAPAPGKATVGIEKLSHDQIKAGMAGVEGKVQACRPPSEGRMVVVVRLRVQADGSVAEAEPLGASPAGACVAEKAKAARFDRFDGPPMTLKYSFTLENDE